MSHSPPILPLHSLRSARRDRLRSGDPEHVLGGPADDPDRYLHHRGRHRHLWRTHHPAAALAGHTVSRAGHTVSRAGHTVSRAGHTVSRDWEYRES